MRNECIKVILRASVLTIRKEQEGNGKMVNS